MRPAPRGYSSARVLRPHFLFSFRKGNGVARQRKRGLCKTRSANRAAIASEEASSIPFPPGRRKLHIRSLLLPSQIVTVSLGHNLAIWNFTTPHAILMMADIFLPVNRSEIFSYILPVFRRFVNGAKAAIDRPGPQGCSGAFCQLRYRAKPITLRRQLVDGRQRCVDR